MKNLMLQIKSRQRQTWNILKSQILWIVHCRSIVRISSKQTNKTIKTDLMDENFLILGIQNSIFVKICYEQLIGRRTHIVSSDCLQIKHKNYYISSISCVFFHSNLVGDIFVHKSKHGWHFEMTSSFHLQKEMSVRLKGFQLKVHQISLV